MPFDGIYENPPISGRRGVMRTVKTLRSAGHLVADGVVNIHAESSRKPTDSGTITSMNPHRPAVSAYLHFM